MSAPDVPTLTLRPTVLERVSAVLSVIFVLGLLAMVAASSPPLVLWPLFLVPSLLVAVYAVSVLTARVVLRGPTLTVHGMLGTRQLTRRDVVAVVETPDLLTSRRRIAALRLTAGGTLRLSGAPWASSARPLQQWLDYYWYVPGHPNSGDAPPTTGRQGWSGPVAG